LKAKLSSFNKYTLDFPLQKTGKIIESDAIKECFKEIVQSVEAYDDIIIELATEE